MCSARRSLLLALTALAMLTTGAFPASIGAQQASSVAATPVAESATPAPGAADALDLAAVALRPADLEAAGLAGAGIEGARQWVLPPDASQDDPDAADARRRGLTQYLLMNLYTSPDPADLDIAPSVQVYVSLVEFIDTTAAAADFPRLRDELEDGDDTDVPDAPRVGDESELTRLVVESDRPDQPNTGDDLDFRDGNVVASVSVIPLNGSSPDPAIVQTLTETLREHLAQVRREGGPDLGRLALRLSGDFDGAADHYLRLDGQALRQYGEAAEMAARREAGYRAATDVYHHHQPAQVLGVETLLDYSAQILDFSDDEAAAEWLANVDARYRNDPAYTDVIPVTAPAYGDASLTLSYRQAPDAGPYTHVRAFARIGARGMAVGVQGIDLPPGVTDAVNALASEQAACLRADDCSSSVVVPLGLRGGAGNTFRDPETGWGLSWDEQTWVADQFFSGDGPRLIERSSLLPLNALRTRIDLTRSTDTGGDPAACRDAMLDRFQANIATASGPLRDDAGTPVADETGDRAFAVFLWKGTAEDGTDAEVAHLECRVLEPGVSTLEVIYVTTQPRYEADARLDALLDRLEAPSGGGAASSLATPAGPPASAEATPVASVAALDLDALLLTSDDLARVGLGDAFGIVSGEYFTTVDEAAFETAEDRGGADPANVAVYADHLASARWQRAYASNLAAPRSDDPSLFGLYAASSIDEFADPTGAAAGFEAYTDEVALTAIEAEAIPDARTIGDESELWRIRGETFNTREPYRGYGITFQRGPLVASVALYDLTGSDPEIAMVEALADRLLTRIDAAQAGELRDPRPLIERALRMPAHQVEEGSYHNRVRRDSVDHAFFGESEADRIARTGSYGTATDVQIVSQIIATGDPIPEDDAWFYDSLLRFPSPEHAAAWVSAQARTSELLPDLPPFGDQSFGFAGTNDRGSGVVAEGAVVYVRVGAEVAIVDLSAVPGISPDVIMPLVAAQTTCLQAGACAGPAAIPAGIATRASAPAATPGGEATPVR